jgi:hypothetical protein
LYQTGQELYQVGPVSLLLAYIVVGTVIYAVMVLPASNARLTIDYPWGNGGIFAYSWCFLHALRSGAVKRNCISFSALRLNDRVSHVDARIGLPMLSTPPTRG